MFDEPSTINRISLSQGDRGVDIVLGIGVVIGSVVGAKLINIYNF